MRNDGRHCAVTARLGKDDPHASARLTATVRRERSIPQFDPKTMRLLRSTRGQQFRAQRGSPAHRSRDQKTSNRRPQPPGLPPWRVALGHAHCAGRYRSSSSSEFPAAPRSSQVAIVHADASRGLASALSTRSSSPYAPRPAHRARDPGHVGKAFNSASLSAAAISKIDRRGGAGLDDLVLVHHESCAGRATSPRRSQLQIAQAALKIRLIGHTESAAAPPAVAPGQPLHVKVARISPWRRSFLIQR